MHEYVCVKPSPITQKEALLTDEEEETDHHKDTVSTQGASDCAAPSDVWVSDGYQWSRVDSVHQQMWHRCHSNNQREHLSVILVSPLSPTFAFPSVMTPCLDSDGGTCIVMSVTMRCHPKLSCANSLEWIFTLWVALLGSHLTGIHLITDFFKSGILWKIRENLLGLSGQLKKWRKVSSPGHKHL